MNVSPIGRIVGTLDQRASATIELAIVAPVIMFMFLGTVEFTNVARVQARLNTATGILAQLVAGDSAVTAPGGTLADRCIGGGLNLLPYSRNSFSADVASITNDHPSARVSGSTDTTTISTYLDWENISSCTTSSPSTMGLSAAYALANQPNSLLTRSGVSAQSPSDLAYGFSAIVVRTTYVYTNVSPYFLGSSITLTGTAVARPRSNAAIQCTNVSRTSSCPSLQ